MRERNRDAVVSVAVRRDQHAQGMCLVDDCRDLGVSVVAPRCAISQREYASTGRDLDTVKAVSSMHAHQVAACVWPVRSLWTIDEGRWREEVVVSGGHADKSVAHHPCRV